MKRLFNISQLILIGISLQCNLPWYPSIRTHRSSRGLPLIPKALFLSIK